MRTKKGIVTSAKMTGTVTVTVHSLAFHPVYKKHFRRSKKFLADLSGHDAAEGDTVVITECRPLSRRKCFRVTEVLSRAPRVSDVQEEAGVEKAIRREKRNETAKSARSAKSETASSQSSQSSSSSQSPQ